MGIKQFWAKQKASASVSARQRELDSVIEQCGKELSKLYKRQFFTSIRSVVDEVDRYLAEDLRVDPYLAVDGRDWRLLRRYEAPEGTAVKYTLLFRFNETFLLGIDQDFRPLTFLGQHHAQQALENGGEPVTVYYAVHWTLCLSTNTAGVVNVSSTIKEEIDPNRDCRYLVNGWFRAPELLRVKFDKHPELPLLEILQERIQQEKPTPAEWAQLPSTRALPEAAALFDKVQAAQERIVEAEAALRALG